MEVLHLDPFKKVFKEEREICLEDLVPSNIEVTELSSGDEDKVMDRAGRFDAVIGAGVEKKFLEKAENLEYYIVPFVGIPETDRENLSDLPDITVINSHFNYWMVAEHAFALLLACTKKLVPIHRKMKEGDWTPRYENERGRGLRNKTLLVLGFGEIGKEVTRMGKSFKMEVKAVKKTPGESDLVEELGTKKDLPRMLSEADFIICTLPETEKTKGYLGKEEFDDMKEGVFLVNVGRGPVIDEKALYEGLKSGKVKGAGIDTWWVYPSDEESRENTFPSNYPLDDFENVVFSPHRATQIEERGEYRIRDLARILKALSQGKDVNVVDIERGY